MRPAPSFVVSLVLAGSLAGCGSSSSSSGGADSKNAAERARKEHEASGEERVSDQDKEWGGWRYRGSRDECFFVVGRTCFSELDAACKAAKCKPSKKGGGEAACKVRGGGPATVSCK